MSRPLRIEYENAWYHVMNRGAGRKDIFHTSEHYQLFLDLLNEIHNRYRIEIHAYCLTPNHYQFLIRTPIANLSRSIKYLNGLYTQRHNKLSKTDGPLFRGRFKSIIVDANNYLLTLSRYIHLNPVAAQIVKNAKQHKWSSFSAYLNNSSAPSWLTTKFILDRFGTKMQIQKYQAFVAEGIDKETNNFFRKIKRLPIMGTSAFVENISQKYLNNKNISREISDHRKIQNSTLPTINKIIKIVANYYNVSSETLLTQCSSGNTPRAIAIYLACQISNEKIQHIANMFTNTSYSGVSQTYSRIKLKIKKTLSLNKIYQFLRTKFYPNNHACIKSRCDPVVSVR